MTKTSTKDMVKAFKDLIGNPKWIQTVEKSVDKQLKSVKDTFDKNLHKATDSLSIITKKDLDLINTKIRSLEKRIDNLEQVNKAIKPKTKAPKIKSEM